MTSNWLKLLNEKLNTLNTTNELRSRRIARDKRPRKFRVNSSSEHRRYSSKYHSLRVYIPIELYEKMKDYCHSNKISYSEHVSHMMEIFYENK